MDNILFGLRLATEDIRETLYAKQKEMCVSNEGMSIILRDVLADFEAKRSNDYARVIMSMVQTPQEAKTEEANEEQPKEE